MDETREQHIKLTLKPEWHSDVIAIIDRIEPGKLAATVIQLLRLYPQLMSQTAQFNMSVPISPVVMVESMAAPAVVAPTEEIVMPVMSTTTRSRVSLDAGFDALND